MRIIFCLLISCQAVVCFAQDEEFPDSRNKKESFLKMQEKDIRKDLASFALAGMDERMNSNPLKPIPPVDYGSDFIKFQGDDITVIIKAGFFDPSKHKLTYFNKKNLVKIDNKPFYGDYGNVPKISIASVTVLIGKDTIAIPPDAYADLYSPQFGYKDASGVARSHDALYICSDKHMNAFYIYMLNKEVKGNYEVTWIIQDKKYLRRVVDTGLMK